MLRIRVKAEVILISIDSGDLLSDQLVAMTEMQLNNMQLLKLKVQGKELKVGVRFHFQEVIGDVNW